ncbi:MAG: hypothetical protein JWM78_1031 [Verrucomicrobiaceae bacterium]|nr:hypothetical protein [Verrucomicrobiaceae bacterium]
MEVDTAEADADEIDFGDPERVGNAAITFASDAPIGNKFLLVKEIVKVIINTVNNLTI